MRCNWQIIEFHLLNFIACLNNASEYQWMETLTSKIALFMDEHRVSPFPWIKQLETGSRSDLTSSSTLAFSVSRQNKMLSPEMTLIESRTAFLDASYIVYIWSLLAYIYLQCQSLFFLLGQSFVCKKVYLLIGFER